MLELRRFSASGGAEELHYGLKVKGEGITGLKFTYRHKGETVASEVIDLVG